jgi:TolB protein
MSTRPFVLLLALFVLLGCANQPQPTPGAQPTSTLRTTPVATETATPAASPTPTPQAQPTAKPLATIALSALTGKIAFEGEGDVYVINADGTGRTQLTTNPARDYDPSWSPDGTKIAFRSKRGGDDEIYVMNADGSQQTNLTNHRGEDWSPAWSPDGSMIAFASMRPDGNGVWVMNADGSDPRPVATPPGVTEYPTWSPDSKRLAFNCTMGRFHSGRNADFEICVANVDGTGLTQLTDTEGNNKWPAWSPDGTKIAFESDRHGWPTLPDETPPHYSPEEYGDGEIYVMDADGSNQINLTNDPRSPASFPTWSRDGAYIGFTGGGCLTVVRADGSVPVQIALCEDGGGFPDWSAAR